VIVTAAGWYPDPEDPTSVRYFDGDQWTDERHPTAPLPAYRPEREPAYAPAEAHVATETYATTETYSSAEPYRPPAYPSPAPSLPGDRDPLPASDYAPSLLDGDDDDDWRSTPRRRSATPRRRRRPVVIAICAAVLAGGLTGGWFVLHKSRSTPFTFDGRTVADPSATLQRAEKSVDALVASRHGVKNSATRCYFAVPATPPPGAKKTDVDSALRCGPVLFVDGDAARAYLSYPLNSTPGRDGDVDLTPSARPIDTQPGLLPVGFTLRRPDKRTAPLDPGLAVPAPQAAAGNTLVAADLGNQPLPDAPNSALMVALRGGVRLTKLGPIQRFGMGDTARSAPPGQRLIAFTYMSVPGQVANNAPPPNQLGVSVNGGPARPLPILKGAQAVVVAVPANGHADFVLNADGVRQTLALPSGNPGPNNLAVLRRNSIDATLAVNKPITFKFTRPSGATNLAGTVTVTHALLGYWTDDGQHHASSGGKALLWMDFSFQAPHQASATGIDAPLLHLTPTGGAQIVAKDVDPSNRVFAVFEVPAGFTKGTVTISGHESGNPAISVVTPVSFPVTLPS
jgi:hypothetical protein